MSILHPEDVEDTATHFGESLRPGKPLEIEHRFRRSSDGNYRWFLTRALPTHHPDGTILKWFGTNVDIDDQKKLEAELKISKIEADRANETKSAYLANMCREIRTPLGAILGFADLLRERTLPEPEREQFLETISRSSKALPEPFVQADNRTTRKRTSQASLYRSPTIRQRTAFS